MLCVNQLSGFGSRRRVAAGGGGVTLTAGNLGGFVGYSNGSYSFFSAFGSISAEPIVGQVLAALFSGGSDEVVFSGDATAALAGLTVWVNGVEYPFDGPDWEFDGEFTAASWVSAGPTFVNGVAYSIEIK